jgi:hypothetical protein
VLQNSSFRSERTFAPAAAMEALHGWEGSSVPSVRGSPAKKRRASQSPRRREEDEDAAAIPVQEDQEQDKENELPQSPAKRRRKVRLLDKDVTTCPSMLFPARHN